jgi:hypothetical protein
MKFLILVAAVLGLAFTPMSAMAGSAKKYAPGQKQATPGQAKRFAPGQRQTYPGQAKKFAPGQQAR